MYRGVGRWGGAYTVKKTRPPKLFMGDDGCVRVAESRTHLMSCSFGPEAWVCLHHGLSSAYYSAVDSDFPSLLLI